MRCVVAVLCVSLWFSLPAAHPALAESGTPPQSQAAQQASADRSVIQHSQGFIDFETFRLISTGMTREEVLKLAGPPANQGHCSLATRCLDRWVYYYDGTWVVEVLFSKSGRAVAVHSDRLQY
jgi:hypothetical protein